MRLSHLIPNVQISNDVIGYPSEAFCAERDMSASEFLETLEAEFDIPFSDSVNNRDTLVKKVVLINPANRTLRISTYQHEYIQFTFITDQNGYIDGLEAVECSRQSGLTPKISFINRYQVQTNGINKNIVCKEESAGVNNLQNISVQW